MADGQQTTATKQGPTDADIKAMTLVERIAYVRDHSDGVGKENIKMKYEGKDGKTQEVTIQGHTIGGVLAGIRPLLRDYRLLCLPNLVERTYNGNRCDVLVEFLWVNIDNPEDKMLLRWGGSDTDKGGKGFAKAGTNAAKEHLKKLFLVTDKHDAEEESEAVEHQTDEGLSRAAADKTAEALREANEKRAKLVRAALQKAADADEVKRLEREHSAWIKQLPEVTRVFFSDLIKTRKAFFAPPTPEELARAEGDDETVWEDREDEQEGAK